MIGIQLHDPRLRIIIVWRGEFHVGLWALKHNRNESSTTRSPRASGAVMAAPLRNTPTHLSKAMFQSSCVISRPLASAKRYHGLRRRCGSAHLRRICAGETPGASCVVWSPCGRMSADRHACQPKTILSKTIRSPGNKRCCCPAGTPDLVAVRDHRRAWLTIKVAQNFGSGGSARPRSRDRRWDLDTTVPRPVVTFAVPVVFAVGVVVFVVVGDQVVEGEPSWAVTKLMLALGRRLLAS